MIGKKQTASFSSLSDGTTHISIPESTQRCWSPTELLQGGDSINPQQSTDWHSLVNAEYDPESPEINYISSSDSEDEATNVDPAFKAKLDQLFGPISP